MLAVLDMAHWQDAHTVDTAVTCVCATPSFVLLGCDDGTVRLYVANAAEWVEPARTIRCAEGGIPRAITEIESVDGLLILQRDLTSGITKAFAYPHCLGDATLNWQRLPTVLLGTAGQSASDTLAGNGEHAAASCSQSNLIAVASSMQLFVFDASAIATWFDTSELWHVLRPLCTVRLRFNSLHVDVCRSLIALGSVSEVVVLRVQPSQQCSLAVQKVAPSPEMTAAKYPAGYTSADDGSFESVSDGAMDGEEDENCVHVVAASDGVLPLSCGFVLLHV